MKKTAFIIMAITLFSKFLGLGRDLFLSYFFGATGISDAYLVSLTIPGVIFGFISIGIVTAYIPMQSRIVSEYGEKEGTDFTNNFVNINLVMVTIILIAGLVFTEQIVKIFALGFSGDTLDLTIKFTRVSLFGMYFSALISIFSGYLQIKNNYIVPALIGLPLNLIVIISILFAHKGNYIILVYGTLLATASQFILLIPFIKKENFKYKAYINFKDEKIIKTLYIALPAVIGISVNQVNTLVDRTIASSIAVGGISALNYAGRLNAFIQGLFVTSIVTVIYPMISSYAAKQDFKAIKKSLRDSINMIMLFVFPLMVGAMVFSTEIVDLLFGRGAFGFDAIKMTSTALFYYSLGMLAFGLREIVSRVFYAWQDTKTPMINASIGMVLNIILNIILSRYMGIGGLALATSISAIFTTALLFISLRKKIGPFGMKQIIISFIKILFASAFMGALAKISFGYLHSLIGSNFALIVAIIVGGVSYLGAIYFMKIDEVDIIKNIVKEKLRKN